MPPSALRSILLRRASHRQQRNEHGQQQHDMYVIQFSHTYLNLNTSDFIAHNSI